MDSREEIKTKIQKSGWGDLEKQQILQKLPSLGSHVLRYLQKRLSKSDFYLIQDELYVSIFDGEEFFEDLQRGDVPGFVKFLERARNESDYGFGEYILPLVLDVQQLITSGKIQPHLELVKILDDIEAEYFQNLTDKDLEDSLEFNFVQFVQRLNIVGEFKTLYYSRGFGFSDWGKPFLEKLFKNEESLGSRPILVDKKTLPQSIKNWLQDYGLSEVRAVSKRSAYDQIQYMEKSPNAKLLQPKERQVLLKIFQLHNFLQKPFVSADEVEEYSREKYKNARSAFQQQEATGAKPAPAKLAAPPGPKSVFGADMVSAKPANIQDILNTRAQGGAGLRFAAVEPVNTESIAAQMEKKRRENQNVIDRKLEDLKNRVAKS